MPKIEIEQKRPLGATPEAALRLVESGVTQVAIAKLWGVHPSRVSALITKAKKRKSAQAADA